MADLSDVEQSLASLIAGVLYPNGTSQPSVVGSDCKVYRGWPNKAQLDDDLAAGTTSITVFPEQGGRNMTRFPKAHFDTQIAAPTITVHTAEPTVTFGGAAGVTQLAGIRTNAGGAWAVAVTATMGPADVAAALGAIVPGASVSGAAVTVTPSAGISGRVAGLGTTLMEVGRQCQPIRITVWAPSILLRDVVTSLVDANMQATDWLTLADSTGGRLRYLGNFTNDVPSKDTLWRRDLRYEVEYPTTLQNIAAQVLFAGGTIDAGAVLPGTTTTFGDVWPF